MFTYLLSFNILSTVAWQFVHISGYLLHQTIKNAPRNVETADAPWQCTFWEQAHRTGFITASLTTQSSPSFFFPSIFCTPTNILHFPYLAMLFLHVIFFPSPWFTFVNPVLLICSYYTSGFQSLNTRHPGKMRLVTSCDSTNSNFVMWSSN